MRERKTPSVLSAALDYRQQGSVPVPIKPGTKRPPMKGWQELRLTEEEIAERSEWRNGREYGVGIILGASGLVDCDLDSEEARALAPSFLPETATFGRKSAPESHRIFKISTPLKTKKYSDILGKGMMVERRSDGAQTMFPPTLHPSGERIRWVDGDKPAQIDADDLARRMDRLAAATLLARHWPEGARHDAALAVAGVLGRAGWERGEAEHFIRQVCRVAGDDEGVDRARAVVDTLRKVEDGERTTGLPSVAAIFGDAVAHKLKQWLRPAGGNAEATDPAGVNNAPDLARSIKERTASIAVGSGERLYVYNVGRGVYVEGEDTIKRVGADLLGPKFSTHRLNEVLALLRLSAPALWDRPPEGVVNVKNGLLNVESGRLRKHTPDHLTSIQVGVAFKPKARCPAIRRFFGEVLPEDTLSALYELIGLLMIPDPRYKRAALFKGPRDSGKSTVIKLITAFVGEANISHLSLHSLVESRFAPAELVDKLLNVYADLDYRVLRNAAVFKVLTGADRITVERKYGQPFDFTPFARHIFSANRPPPTSDTSGAFFSRWLVFPFKDTVAERDPRLIEKLTKEEELSGLLNLALQGLKRLQDRGDFTIGKSAKRAADQYRRSADPIAAFLDEEVRRDPKGFILRSELYDGYERECLEHKMQAGSRQAFNDHVRELLGSRVQEAAKKRGRGWKGISWKSGLL